VLCTTEFVDDVMFSQYNGAVEQNHRQSYVLLSSPGGSTGAKLLSTIADLFVSELTSICIFSLQLHHAAAYSIMHAQHYPDMLILCLQ